MRSFLAFLLGLCALAAAMVAIPGMWVAQNVVDESGYVALADPLGKDPDFQEALSRSLTDAILSESDLAQPVQQAAEPRILKAAQKLTSMEGFPQAWTETNRRSHALIFDDSGDAKGDSLTLDVGPLGQLLIGQIDKSLDVDVAAPKTIRFNVGGESERNVVDFAKKSNPRAYWLAGISVVLALLALVVARRRMVAVWWLGLGTLLIAGLLKIGASVILPFLADGLSSPSAVAGELQDLLVEAAVKDFNGWILVVAIVGGVLAVVGGIGRVVMARRGAYDDEPGGSRGRRIATDEEPDRVGFGHG